jgi:hypothetical protein
MAMRPYKLPQRVRPGQPKLLKPGAFWQNGLEPGSWDGAYPAKMMESQDISSFTTERVRGGWEN